MLKSIYTQLHYIPQAIIVSALLLMAYIFLIDNRGKIRERLKEILKKDRSMAFFLIYSALLFTGTVLGRPYTDPYKDIIGCLGFTKKGKFVFISLENILIFVPYTFLYIKAFRPKKVLLRTLICTITTTVFIELFQLIFWVGQFQIADLVHNTIGGMLGCILWYFVCWIKNLIKRGKQCEQNNEEEPKDNVL